MQSRAGHCEYFASAAVLLLRRAGIPARYARGWSVQEYSVLEQAYVARARHSHAWVLAWVDGAWQDFDPTPPDWGLLEAQNRPWWGALQDLLGRLGHVLAHGESDGQGGRTRLAWLLLPLVALLAWRIIRRGRRRTRRAAAEADIAPRDSPFNPVQTVLARRGGARREGETLREWVQRLELYYRKRFDPAGLQRHEMHRLSRILEEFLSKA